MSGGISLYYDDLSRSELDAAMLVLKDQTPEVKVVELADPAVSHRVRGLAGCEELPMAAVKGHIASGTRAITYMAAAAAKMLPDDPLALLQTAGVLEVYTQIYSILSQCDVTDGQSRDRALTKDIPPLCLRLEKMLTLIENSELKSESDTAIECCVTSLWRRLTSEELYREGEFRTFYPKMTELMERYTARQRKSPGICAVCTGDGQA